MNIGIVGNGSDKFTLFGTARAMSAIRKIVKANPHSTVVSGHSPMGGIDIWAETIGRQAGLTLDIKAPEVDSWEGGYGYRARNLDIARCSDIVYVIVADAYPVEYDGTRFKSCYHCHKADHVKSGACWTAKRAIEMGKTAEWIVIENYGGDIVGDR